MRKMTLLLIMLFVVTGFVLAQTPSTTQDAVKTYQNAEKAYVDAALELQRIDIRNQKRAIIQKAVTFTPDQSKAFWPIYDKYEKNLVQINDERLATIKDYAAHYEAMTDEKAAELITRAMDFQDKRFALRKSYLDEVKTVLPAKMVARLMQLENQMDLLIDLQIASEVPLVK